MNSIAALLAALPLLAQLHLPVLVEEQQKLWPSAQGGNAAILAGMVEKETCYGLKSKRCWNPRTELKTHREYGFGLGQITITKTMNVFEELREHHRELRNWAWDDRYDATMQLKALILKNKRNYNAIKGTASEYDRTAMTVSAYNGGLGAIFQDRRYCAQFAECDSTKWTGNVEKYSRKSKKSFGPKYGNRSPYSINRDYTRAVMGKSSERYRKAVEALSRRHYVDK